MVKIANRHDAEAWIQDQPIESGLLIAARCALRALPSLCEETQPIGKLSLPILRSMLLGIVDEPHNQELLLSAIKSANRAYEQAANARFEAFADFAHAAESTAYTRYLAKDSAVKSRCFQAIRYSASSVAASADDLTRSTDAYKAMEDDVRNIASLGKSTNENQRPLWQSDIPVPELKLNYFELRNRWQEDAATWGFWERWYNGLLNGEPLDWGLQGAIARIDPEEWDRGPARIAELIRRIEARFADEAGAVDSREPEYEPTSVDHLLRNRRVASAQTMQVSVQIAETIELFHSTTALNSIPETFAALQPMAHSFSQICATLQSTDASGETETKLREEIGRLNARVAELEKALEAALTSGDPIVAPAFKEQLGKSLGDWKLYAALCGGLWLVSGDQLGMQQRLENLQSVREKLFGDVCPTPRPNDDRLPSGTYDT